MRFTAEVHGVSFSECSRRYADAFLEGAVKVADVGKTDAAADLADVDIAVGNVLTSLANAHIVQIIDDGDAGIFFKKGTEIVAVVAYLIGDLLKI